MKGDFKMFGAERVGLLVLAVLLVVLFVSIELRSCGKPTVQRIMTKPVAEVLVDSAQQDTATSPKKKVKTTRKDKKSHKSRQSYERNHLDETP